MFKQASDLRPVREVSEAPAYLLVILYRKDVMIPQAITNTWPWYVAGPIIGLFVPILLLMGDKRLGISGNLRHLCSALLPQRIDIGGDRLCQRADGLGILHAAAQHEVLL